jgi:hypothetical protein
MGQKLELKGRQTGIYSGENPTHRPESGKTATIFHLTCPIVIYFLKI